MSDRPEPLSNRALTVGIVALVLLVIFFVGFCAPPPSHAVHTPAGVDVSATDYAPVPPDGPRIGATQLSTSLAELGVATFFPQVRDATANLYLLWYDCGIGSDPGWGPVADGYNVEFIPGSRQLLIHCYDGRPYVMSRRSYYGIAPTPPVHLLVISTPSLGAGSITVAEESDLERWFGDERFGPNVIGTATIS